MLREGHLEILIKVYKKSKYNHRFVQYFSKICILNMPANFKVKIVNAPYGLSVVDPVT